MGFVCTHAYFSIKTNFIHFSFNVCAYDSFNNVVQPSSMREWPYARLMEAVINGQCVCTLTRFINI